MDKWKMVRLGDIVEKPLSGEWGNEDKTGTGVPVLRTTNFTDEGIIDYTNVVFREISQKKFETKALKYGDIIIEKSGGSDTKPVGRVVYYDGAPRQYIYNNFTASLRVNTDAVDTRYAFLFLFYYYKIGITARFENKTTGIHNLRLNNFLDQVKIPLPPLEEQKRIAKTLDLASEIVKGYKEQIAELDKLMQSVFYAMFGDPVRNEKGWEMVYLYSLADIKIGPFGSLLHKEDYISGGHALVNPSHIIGNVIIPDNDLTISDEKYQELGAYRLQKGDIVLGRRGEMGRCAVVEDDSYICGTGSLIIRPGNEIHSHFLQRIISYPTFKKCIENCAVGVTMMNLNVPIVSKFKIISIPLSLQIRFASIVTEIEAQKAQIQQALTEAENLFNSLMQGYFE